MRGALGCLILFAAGSPVVAGSKSEQAAFAVVKAFYEAANHSECGKAEAFFAEDAVKALRDSLGPGGFSVFCLDKAGKAPLNDVKFVKADIKKDAADVLVERSYGDGSRFMESEHLILEKGTWKLAVSPKKP
jgi:hypothetical protein